MKMYLYYYLYANKIRNKGNYKYIFILNLSQAEVIPSSGPGQVYGRPRGKLEKAIVSSW
jgi:hypothetical protein